MNPAIYVNDLGLMDYFEAWELQKELFNQIIEKKQKNEATQNTLLLVEHPHVYTLGKSGERENLLISDDRLKQIKAKFVQIDRGGDITYHGPGQLVVYPIFDLESFGIRTREFVFRLEDIVIELLRQYNIAGSRMESAAGVWLDAENESARRICSVGIKSSRGATMHGIALNISTDLNYFSYINPCGFVDKGMTSMQKETLAEINWQDIVDRFTIILARIFSANMITTGITDKSFPSC